jgi:hypothetical protein
MIKKYLYREPDSTQMSYVIGNIRLSSKIVIMRIKRWKNFSQESSQVLPQVHVKNNGRVRM